MKRLDQPIGFIGCGNMGSAIVAGLLAKKVVRKSHIVVFDKDRGKLKSAVHQFGVKAAASDSELVRRSGVIFLAIKPQDLSILGGEIKSFLNRRHTVISILAGTPVAKLKRALRSRAAIVRAMPNLGAQVGESVTAITSLKPSALRIAESIFSSCGNVIQLPERYFDLVTVVSGSGPAYFFLVMELLSKAARKAGLSNKLSDQLAVQTAFGAAKLARLSIHAPAELRKKVTSKKGTTEAALTYFSSKGFEKIFLEGVQRAVKRARELSQA